MNENKIEVPKLKPGDTFRSLFESIASEFPVGSVGVYVFGLLLQPEYEKRLDHWRKEITDNLNSIKFDHVKISDLQNNKEFISVLFHASQSAIRTHQVEKIEALKNSVINSADKINIDGDLQLRFISFIDEFTPTHLIILNFFQHHGDLAKDCEKYEDLYNLITNNLKLNISKDFFKLVIEDLSARNLLRVSSDIEDFDDVHKSHAILDANEHLAPMIQISSIGKLFIKFINL